VLQNYIFLLNTSKNRIHIKWLWGDIIINISILVSWSLTHPYPTNTPLAIILCVIFTCLHTSHLRRLGIIIQCVIVIVYFYYDDRFLFFLLNTIIIHPKCIRIDNRNVRSRVHYTPISNGCVFYVGRTVVNIIY